VIRQSFVVLTDGAVVFPVYGSLGAAGGGGSLGTLKPSYHLRFKAVSSGRGDVKVFDQVAGVLGGGGGGGGTLGALKPSYHLHFKAIASGRGDVKVFDQVASTPGATPPPTPSTGVDGGRLPRGGGRKVPKRRHVPARLIDQHPEDIEREQRMVEEYVQSLEKAEKTAQPATKATIKPRLTQAMAAIASTQQLARIAKAELVAKEDREKAEKEHQRRRAAATAVLMMSH
jgi:hypothetical protein